MQKSDTDVKWQLSDVNDIGTFLQQTIKSLNQHKF